MSSFLPIEPKVEPQPDLVYTELCYQILSITPNVSAKILAAIFTEGRLKRKDYTLELVQPEYNQWGSDDIFIQNWVLQQIGAVIKPEPLVEESEPLVEEIKSSDIPDASIE